MDSREYFLEEPRPKPSKLPFLHGKPRILLGIVGTLALICIGCIPAHRSARHVETTINGTKLTIRVTYITVAQVGEVISAVAAGFKQIAEDESISENSNKTWSLTKLIKSILAAEQERRDHNAIGECSKGYTLHETTNRCYKKYSPETIQDAYRLCWNDNAELAPIETQAEKDILIKHFEIGFMNYNRTVWAAYPYDAAKEQIDGIVPESNKTMENVKTEHFATEIEYDDICFLVCDGGKPQKPPTLKWKIVGHPNYYPFVCQKPVNSLESLEVERTRTPRLSSYLEPKIQPRNEGKGTCDTGYTYFEKTGYCYKKGKGTFELANKTCVEDENANLLSVHSKEENTFIADLVTKDIDETEHYPIAIHLGIVYKKSHWEWLDGTEVGYTNWDKFMPYATPCFEKNFACTRISMSIYREHERERNGDKWTSDTNEDILFVCKKMLRMIDY